MSRPTSELILAAKEGREAGYATDWQAGPLGVEIVCAPTDGGRTLYAFSRADMLRLIESGLVSKAGK